MEASSPRTGLGVLPRLGRRRRVRRGPALSASSASPSAFLLPTPEVAARVEAAVAEVGAEVVLFGATLPVGAAWGRGSRRGARRTSRRRTASSTGSR